MEVRDTAMPACIFETGSIRANIAYLTTPAPYGAIIAQGSAPTSAWNLASSKTPRSSMHH
ncbi:hypothetical protein [Eubacterium aggregans]|uniref:hypothetical protein n=1 Tax=Eubacterium aggregans TaxID=81409 RepID=UPI000B80008B|nr:hypothetical protein [Eubacterium aggregans]